MRCDTRRRRRCEISVEVRRAADRRDRRGRWRRACRRNGRGPGHFGLRGLAERVEHLGGTFHVGNREPRGVRADRRDSTDGGAHDQSAAGRRSRGGSNRISPAAAIGGGNLGGRRSGVRRSWHASATSELTPDVVVMDLAMPGMGGLEALRRIRAAGSPRPGARTFGAR